MIPHADMHRLRSLSRAARGGTLDVQRLAERAYLMGFDQTNPANFNLADLERAALKKALEQTGSVVAASRLLGIGKTTAYRKIKQYHLERRTPS